MSLPSPHGISTIWANDPRPRLSVSINITGLYSGLVSKIFQKNGFPKTQAGRHDGSFLAVRTRDSNQGRPRTHTEPKISPGYHTLAASKCSQSSAAWYLPLHEHARGRKFIFISKKTLFQRNLAASCDGRALPIRTRDSNQGGLDPLENIALNPEPPPTAAQWPCVA